MLKKIRAWTAHHVQAATTSFNYLCNKPLATSMTILVIAITLALPTLFWVFTDNIEQLTANWQQGGHISLYLNSSQSSTEETAVLARVKATPGVGHVTLKSSAAGLAELQAQEGMEDIMRYLPENPLPTTLEVTPVIEINTPEKLDHLYQQLKAYPQVEQAKLDMQWITRLHAILSFATKTAHGLMIFLASAVVLIIGNTLKLAIQSRQEEIQVLKLVGATDPYIIRPFLYSGILYGLIGAIIAVLLVNIFILSLAISVNKLAAAYQMHYPLLGLSMRQVLLLLVAATLLGWLGACGSVKRQLTFIEPCK